MMAGRADMFNVSAKTPKGEVVLKAVRLRMGSFRATSASLRNPGSVGRELGTVCDSAGSLAEAVPAVRLYCALEVRGVRVAGSNRALEMDGHSSVVADAMDGNPLAWKAIIGLTYLLCLV